MDPITRPTNPDETALLAERAELEAEAERLRAATASAREATQTALTERRAAERERVSMRVDAFLAANGDRITPGQLRTGLREAIIELSVSEPVVIELAEGGETVQRTAAEIVLAALAAAPPYLALLGGRTAGAEADAGAPRASGQVSAEEREINKRFGITPEREAELAERFKRFMP